MPAVPSPDSPLATRDDIRRLEHLIAALQATMDRIVHDQDVQFKRIAQLQADIDLVRGAWAKITAEPTPPKSLAVERRLAARKK